MNEFTVTTMFIILVFLGIAFSEYNKTSIEKLRIEMGCNNDRQN